MALPKPPFHGACLCGAVQVHITASPILTFACHCRDCQKLSASAFTLTTAFPRDGFVCEGELVRGGLKSPAREHFYCPSCLTLVYSRITAAEDRVNLRTSILDDAAQFAPFVEMMTDEKQPWAHVPVAYSFARFPQSFEEMQALFRAYEGS